MVRVHIDRSLMDHRHRNIPVLNVLLPESDQRVRTSGLIPIGSADVRRRARPGHDLHSALHRQLQED